MSTGVLHPLPVDTIVEFERPICPCKGGGKEVMVGTVLKVITNASGIWYYLNVGSTVQSHRILRVVVPQK